MGRGYCPIHGRLWDGYGKAGESGAGDRNRTYDPIITNDVLYQLSYSGAGRAF